MRKQIRTSLLATVLCASALTSDAAIAFNIAAGRFTDNGGTDVASTTLFQLINLGSNGVFDPISLLDGDISSMGQWVSGDDTLITVAYEGGDFPTLAAFDLYTGPGSSPTGPGVLERNFVVTIAAGIKVGLRWFPGIQATEFSNTTLVDGQSYGEFTRQSSPLNGGSLWITGADGSPGDSFDGLVTADLGGSDPIGAGMANKVVPEPAAIGMSLIGAAGLALLRRRRP